MFAKEVVCAVCFVCLVTLMDPDAHVFRKQHVSTSVTILLWKDWKHDKGRGYCFSHLDVLQLCIFAIHRKLSLLVHSGRVLCRLLWWFRSRLLVRELSSTCSRVMSPCRCDSACTTYRDCCTDMRDLCAGLYPNPGQLSPDTPCSPDCHWDHSGRRSDRWTCSRYNEPTNDRYHWDKVQ